jgi:SAM-dependent methyltransferase
MRSGVRPCGRPDCAQSTSRRLTGEYVEALGRLIEVRICGDCGLGFVEPGLSDEEVGSLYSEDYAYYGDVASTSPSRRDRWKYRIAGWRHARLVRRGFASSVVAAVAALIERAAGKTITYSLGVPLALGRRARILDYGCGSGEWLLHLASLGFDRLWGADISPNRGFQERLAKAGITALGAQELHEFPEGSFDAIRLEHVLEHLPRPVPVLADLRRLLTPGGWLVLTVPSILPWRDRSDLDASSDRAFLQIPMHLAHHSEASLPQLLREAGLDVVSWKATKVERYLTAVARRAEGAIAA